MDLSLNNLVSLMTQKPEKKTAPAAMVLPQVGATQFSGIKAKESLGADTVQFSGCCG